MLFSSLEFLIFLPCVLAMFFALDRYSAQAAIAWLVLASLFYYGWWNPKYLLLIIPLLFANYIFGLLILKYKNKALLILGVGFNLAVLGYFKYANFFVDNLRAATDSDFHLAKIILPLGISFFTFQKIAYLVDAYRGEVKEHKFLNFSLFVLFFPQLIAGPIVHHKEIIPQFRQPRIYKFKIENLCIGLTIFIIGLFKKLVLADNAALFASPVFDAAAHGATLTFFEAWGAALCYTFQLYFDFSGYSDMAIGAARMFGIILPINFNSPYKAANIIEFWRRWHMSLSRFLRDYIYIPLGGNRRGQARRYINLFITMLLAGLWHGAGWTFVIWGALHGTYLMINHSWHFIARRSINVFDNRLGKIMALIITFLCVVAGWVIFRAENLSTAVSMLGSMAGNHGISTKYASLNQIVRWKGVKDLLVLYLFIIWFLPNSMDLLAKFNPAQKYEPGKLLLKFHWKPSSLWALVMAVMTAASIIFMLMTEKSEFLYFDF